MQDQLPLMGAQECPFVARLTDCLFLWETEEEAAHLKQQITKSKVNDEITKEVL